MKALKQKSAPDSTVVLTALKERIYGGHYQSGTWLSPQRDLAEEFGVDRSAIRMALADLVSEGLIVQKKGCRPLVSDTRPGRRTAPAEKPSVYRIAAIAYHQEQFSGVQSLLKASLRRFYEAEDRYDMIVIDTDAPTGRGVAEKERSALAALERGEMDGALLWHNGGSETVPDVQRLLARGIPLVLVDQIPEGVTCDFVGNDDWQTAWDAVEYLASLGHKQIVHLSETNEVSTGRQRAVGFRDAMSSILGVTDPDIVYCMDHVSQPVSVAIRQGVDHCLSMPERPTAIFVVSDYLAFLTISELESRGLSIPGDISVMGCDDLERFLPTPRRLTSMHIPFDRIGYRASGLLIKRLSQPDEDFPREHILLPTKVVEGLTCRCVN